MDFRKSFNNSDTVKNTLEKLMRSNIIPPKTVHFMKQLEGVSFDPNLVMDERHKAIKRASIKHHSICWEKRNEKSLSISFKSKSTRSSETFDFKTVETEIKNVRVHLERERKRVFNSDSFTVTEERVQNNFNSYSTTGSGIISVNTLLKERANTGIKSERHNRKIIPPPMAKTGSMQFILNNDKADRFNDSGKTCEVELNNISKDSESDCSSQYNLFHEEESVLSSHSDELEESELLAPVYNNSVTECQIVLNSRQTDPKTKGLLLKKYWNIWQKNMHREREERQQQLNDTIREGKIKRFLSLLQTECSHKKIHEKKETTQSNFDKGQKKNFAVPKTFEHRIKAQGEIIAKQKSKLEEQKKVIQDLQSEQLKLQAQISSKKICESIKDLKANVKNVNSKSTLRSLQVLNDNEAVDAKTILKRMRLREEERQERWKIIKERKRAIEEEKKRQTLLAEEEKRQAEEEQKRLKIMEIKTKRQQQRQLLEEQERKKQQLKVLHDLACKHHRKSLLAKSFASWKLFSERENIKAVSAKEEYEKRLKLKCFKQWLSNVRIVIQAKIDCMQKYYEDKILRKSWNVWSWKLKQHREQIQVALDLYEYKLQSKSFIAWLFFTKESKEETERLELKADTYYNRVLKYKCLKKWILLPKLTYEERERELRIRQWNSKVQEIIPDFCPQIEDDGNAIIIAHEGLQV